MALRRVLPSRATPAPATGGEAVTPAAKVAPRNENRAPEAPATPPEPLTPPPAAPENRELAAAASSAFSTLPAAPARVLEESFTAAPATLPEPEPQPEPPVPAAPVAPQVEIPAAPAEPAAAPALPAAELPVAPLDIPGFGVAEEPPAPKFEAPAPAEPAPQPEEPATQAEPAPAEPVLELQESQLVEAGQPQEPAPAPAEPGSQPEPAKPSRNAMRRRVREKRPRDFSAAKGPDAEPEQPKTETRFDAKVPVNTQPLNKVDENLIASGILSGPPKDSLTSATPTGVAESESDLPPLPEPEPQPAPRQPEAEPAPAQPEPQPAAPQPAPQPTPAEPAASPFDLSKPPAAIEPLPPTQSDLPWTTPQPAADWDIAVPETPSWSHEGLPGDTIAAEPAQLPPPADVYRPQPEAGQTLANPPWAAGGGGSTPVAPRAASTLPPPELPRHTPRRSGGTPWGMVVVGLLVAGGAAYLAFKPGGGNYQQQIARLTGALHEQPGDAAAVSGTAFTGLNQATTGDLLPAPSSTLFSGAPLPPPVATAAENATSGSAVIAFTDVTPEQAKQPIVSDGSEQMPEKLSLAAEWQKAVLEARERKEGKLPPEDASATSVAAEPGKTDTAEPFTEAKLQEELANYRRALAESPDPASIKPNQFLKDPDAYMDGKPQQTVAANTAAEGQATAPAATDNALLPPPELYTNNPKNLPVVAEPVANAPARIRTLADIQGATPFAPERDHVEIPKGLKPRLAATDFPALEVLSFVPGRGIVAYSDGREGVLLIGETLNGWELVGVAPDHAEFKAGQKTYQVSADN